VLESGGRIAATADGEYESRVVEEYDGGTTTTDPNDPDASDDSGPDIETVRVTTSKRDAHEVRQVRRETQRPESEAADPSDWDDASDEPYRWTADAMYASIPEDEDGTCTPSELRLLKLPLVAGATWSDHMDCKADGANGEPGFASAIDVSSKVIGSKHVTALGRSMLVWEIVTELRSKTTAAGKTVDSTMTRDALFAPEIGFEVHAVEQSDDGEAGMGRYKSTTDLLSFKPA
jgi:hypothetical protein